jgi:putative transposase
MNKAREYPNCRVIICGEEYTSQTCSECGYLHRKIGGSKKFKCPGCNQESDRDFNAARNILLKNMILGFRD